MGSKLVSYLHHTQDFSQQCWVGDPLDKCLLAAYADSSYADGQQKSNSTSGVYLVLLGPRTFVPLAWLCKKQGTISTSSIEAEVVALDTAMRLEALPLLNLLDLAISVLNPSRHKGKGSTHTKLPVPRSFEEELTNCDFVPATFQVSTNGIKLVLLEDNNAVIQMIVKGRSPNMRHVPRTHRIGLDWLFERIMSDPAIRIKSIPTSMQLADIFTKGSFNGVTWRSLCIQAQIQSRAPAFSAVVAQMPRKGKYIPAVVAGIPQGIAVVAFPQAGIEYDRRLGGDNSGRFRDVRDKCKLCFR